MIISPPPTDQNSNHKKMKTKTKTKTKTTMTMVAATTTARKRRRREGGTVGVGVGGAAHVLAKEAVGNDDNAPDDGESGYYDVERWTSRHYDNEDGDDNEEVEKDLFDPDPKKNRSFVGGRDSFGEGADDDGMFLR